MVGCTHVDIEHNAQYCSQMQLLTVAGAGPTLLHRLQLSRNLRNRPGYFNFVPGPGRPC